MEQIQNKLKRILKKLPYTLLWQKDGFRPRPQFARELKRLILLEPGSPWDFAAQVYRVLFKKKWAGMVNTRFLFSRKFKECTYYLLSDLPKSELTPSSGEIELENNHFKYQLDEDRLGILLLKKGEISGLTGFQRLKMNGTPIVDGPGFFYARQNAPGKWNVAALVPGRFNFMNRQVSFIQKDVGQAREICLADGNHAK